MADLDRVHLRVRSMLDLSASTDVLQVYHAFYHHPDRNKLLTHDDVEGLPTHPPTIHKVH